MPSDGQAIRLTVRSDPHAVRAALRGLFEGKPLRRLRAGDRGAAELVLAEVLNNVVEHACAAAGCEIEVTIRMLRGSLDCTIVDHGRVMPGETLPRGDAPLPDGNGGLPEGGFGWLLIRSLASDLAYRRIGDRNELSFRLPREQ